MQTLKLDQNSFSVFPDDFATLTNLEELGTFSLLIISYLILMIKSSLHFFSLSLFSKFLLVLSHCELWAIPLSIFKCIALKKLDLSYNKLGELPLDFKYLSNLISLNLKQNLLTSLPDSLPLCYKLQYLCLSGNRLKEVYFT